MTDIAFRTAEPPHSDMPHRPDTQHGARLDPLMPPPLPWPTPAAAPNTLLVEGRLQAIRNIGSAARYGAGAARLYARLFIAAAFAPFLAGAVLVVVDTFL